MERRDVIASAALFAVVVLTLWSYHGVLHAPFHFDDSLFLESPQVTSPGGLSHLLRPAQTRQLTYLSFYVNYRLGGTNPEGYHLVNLLLHLANILLVFLFVRLLTEGRADVSDRTVQCLLPAAAAGIFALHPIQSEAVNYAYQRSTLLAALFSLLALIAFLWSVTRPGRAAWKWLAVPAWLLAMASKELAWILPLVVFACLWAYEPDFASMMKTLRRMRCFLAVNAVLMVSGAFWLYFHVVRSGDRTIGYLLAGNSIRYLMGQVQVFAAYLRLLFWPAGLSVDHDFRAASFWSPYGLACLLLLLGVLASCPLVRRVKPTVAFLLAAFLLFLAPTSSILPSADLMFEHRLYLPMIAASTLLAWGVISTCCSLLKQRNTRLAACSSALAMLLIGYALAARQRTFVWGNDVRLWEDAVAKSPHNSRARYNLGVAFLGVDKERARREFAQVDETSPSAAAALYNLGWIDQSGGLYDSARAHYFEALKHDAGNWRAHQNLGNINLIQGRRPLAMMEYRETIRLKPDYWPAYQSLATLQLEEGYPADALATLVKLKQLRPDLLEAEYLSAFAFIECKRFSEAEAELRQLESRDTARAFSQRITALRLRMQ